MADLRLFRPQRGIQSRRFPDHAVPVMRRFAVPAPQNAGPSIDRGIKGVPAGAAGSRAVPYSGGLPLPAAANPFGLSEPAMRPTEKGTVNADPPTPSTHPSQTDVTLGPPVTLNDTSFLQGGFNPTGTITFTLIGPDGVTVVDTEMVLVFGNGLYSTPHGFTPGVNPGGPDLTGTYQWNASYSGDDNNNTASDNNDPTEQVTVNADTPTLSTTPDQASVTLGDPVTLTDTADLEGGVNPP